MTRRWIAAAVLATAATLLIGREIAGAYVDYQWFASLGAAAVWKVRMVDTLLLRLFCGLVAGAFAFVNLVAMSNSVASVVLPRRVANLEIGERVPGQRLIAAAGIAAVLMGLLLSLPLDDWATFDRARILPRFGEEAYTGRDLGFYVYWLPFENALYTWSLLVLFSVTGVVLALYALTTSLRWERGRLRITGYVRRHLTVLGVVLLMLLAWGHRLDAYALLFDGSGPRGEFSFIDEAVTQPARLALSVFTAGAALLVLRGGWIGQTRLAFGAVTAVLAATLLLHVVVPWVAHETWQPPERAARDRDAVATRALVTQRAYAVTDSEMDTSARAAEFGLVTDAARGVPIWDPPALTQAIERGRRVGLVVGDIGWQLMGGRVVAVAAERAGVPGGEEPNAAPWRLLRVAATSANERGAPQLVDAAGELAIGESAPEVAVIVYPGAAGALIVADTSGRVVGEPVRTVSSRLAQAWSQRDLRLLLSERLPPVAAEIVRRRDVRERVAALAPYFAQGTAVAALALGDSLFWTVELYSTSTMYPLSQRYLIVGSERSYFQHAATAVVSAQSGTVLFVRDQRPDSIAAGWFTRFPSIYPPRDAVRPDLLAALPPETDGALTQARVFAQFGLRNDPSPAAREFPRSDGADSTLVDGVPALLAVSRSGREVALAWTVPLLDRSTRIAGLVLALGGRDRNVLWLPSAATAARWTEVNERLARASDSGAAARGDGERPPVNGRVRAFPTAGGFAYAQPFYLLRGDNVPAFGFAALLAGDSLAVGQSVAAAAGVVGPLAGDPATSGDFRTRTDALYAAMRGALRRGDWVAFGAAFDALGRLLGRAPE